MKLSREAEQYILDSQEELKQLIRELCAIPAPSHHEGARAAFCKQWFEKNGGKNVTVDDAQNVICPYRVTEDNELAVVMAHTDTVFPDTEPMPFREEGGRMFCPGVTDDTANLAVMMICARYILQKAPTTDIGVLFVADSCEEGLGNLKGSRAVTAKYGSRMKELVTLDGANLTAVVTRAVGSHRYRVRATTGGGHSFRDFGKPNAIAILSELVHELYRVEPPAEGGSRTTYNVGVISGGTSVNTIAQSAELLYEYRSDDPRCLAKMEGIFRDVLAKCAPKEGTLSAERIGERPCAGQVDQGAMGDLIQRAAAAVRAATGREPVFTSGSTDCNIPLAAGIPAVCLGVCVGGGCHTREEWLDPASLADGCRLFLEFFGNYLKN